MPREIVKKPRFIYPQIATSLSIAKLSVLAELLFWRLLPQADDQGRLPGNPLQLKATVCPIRKEFTDDNITGLLTELENARLIILYSNSSTDYIQIAKWWDYQGSMRRVFPSQYPPPPGWQDIIKGVEPVEETGPKIAEHGIRDLILDALTKGEIQLGDGKIIEVNKEVRIGSSYIDLLAKDSASKFYIIEIKRTRLTNSHIEQIINYSRLIQHKTGASPSLLLIGYGIVSTFNSDMAKTHSINIITYDDQLSCRQVVLSDVKWVGKITRLNNRLSRQVVLSDVSRPEEEEEVEEEREKELETRIREEEEEKTTTATAETATESKSLETHEGSKRATETAKESKMLGFLETLEGWRFRRVDDLAWLREFCRDWPDLDLSLAKACRDYYSGEPPPKNKGPWKNRFRQWMIHERDFGKARSGKKGAKTGEQRPRQERARPITYFRGSEEDTGKD